MAQARTCEEYVIQELYHKDAVIESHLIRIEDLKKQLEVAYNKIQDLASIVNIFNPRIDTSVDGEDLFINVTSVWKRYDDEYNFIKDTLDLEEPETEVEETSDEA